MMMKYFTSLESCDEIMFVVWIMKQMVFKSHVSTVTKALCKDKLNGTVFPYLPIKG
jgi:hypothetical protein